MKTPPLVALLGAICAATACGGKTAGVDGSASSSGSNASGGNGSVGGSSSGGTNGGNIANGGIGGAISSAIGLGGSGNTSATGGASPMGGFSNTGGVPTAGGTSAWHCPVCKANSCGIIFDSCNSFDKATIDCGFNNCPQEICGKDAPNECPPACSAKPDCKSAGNRNCGFISDSCGGVIDCGTCPDGQCCGCGTSASPASPNVCGSGSGNEICWGPNCGAGMCGKMVDSCGSVVIDCGPCCKPQTCEDACPEYPSGNIRQCTSQNDGQRYLLPCSQPDGCSGTIDCWCPLG